MISATSRYQSSTVNLVTDDRGTHQSLNIPAPKDRVFTFTYYQVEAYDRIDDMAHRFLGSGSLWWMLADANPEILDWQDLAPGTVLRIPSV